MKKKLDFNNNLFVYLGIWWETKITRKEMLW